MQLIKPFKPCGVNSFLIGPDMTTANMPCTCGPMQPDGSQIVNEVGASAILSSVS